MVDPAWIAEIAALEQAVPWIPTDDDMPNAIAATKRIHVERSDAMDSWWFGYGKDQGCCIEGTPCHWYWLAYILLGLAKESDAPYTEDAPLPYSPKKIAACLATVPKLVQTCRALAAELEASDDELMRLHGLAGDADAPLIVERSNANRAALDAYRSGKLGNETKGD